MCVLLCLACSEWRALCGVLCVACSVWRALCGVLCVVYPVWRALRMEAILSLLATAVSSSGILIHLAEMEG